MADAVLAYHRLNAALSRFDKSYRTLDPDERRLADGLAARSLAIESAVLASPEADAIGPAEDRVSQAMATIRERYADAAEFAEDLGRNGMSPEDLRHALRRELRAQAILEARGDRAPVPSEDELLGWYEAHRERFAIPETREARHILITITAGSAENCRESASARIGDLHAQLASDPSAFEALAARHSECPTALDGGRIGRVTRGQLFPQIDAALFAMDEGTMSGVIESEIGFHLIRCDEIHPARIAAFAEARERILAAMTEKRRKQEIARWLSELTAGPSEAEGRRHDKPMVEHRKDKASCQG